MRELVLFSRISVEFDEFKEEMLRLEGEDMFEFAERIYVYQIARDIMEYRIDMGKANLLAYESIDRILARYFDFHERHQDYVPTEIRIMQFENEVVGYDHEPEVHFVFPYAGL